MHTTGTCVGEGGQFNFVDDRRHGWDDWRVTLHAESRLRGACDGVAPLQGHQGHAIFDGLAFIIRIDVNV